MFKRITAYLQTFTEQFGQGWNRFWFTPSDPYMLGLLRLTTGMVLLYLHLSFTSDIVNFYGPEGMLPVDVVEQLRPIGQDDSLLSFHPKYLSHLFHLDTANELMVAHWIGAGVLLLFTVGYRSRLMTVLTLLLTLAYCHRGPMLTSAVEPILCMLLFYLCFGPTGESWSIDRLLAKRRAENDPKLTRELSEPRCTFGATISLRLIQVHVTLIYLMMGFGKLSGPGQTTGEWMDVWGGGRAVWWLIARAESRWFDLTWMADTPYLVDFWTHAIIIFELAFAVFIWNRLARPLLLLIAVPMWLSLALISGLAPFCVAMLVANLAFFSPMVMREVFSSKEQPAKETATAAS